MFVLNGRSLHYHKRKEREDCILDNSVAKKRSKEHIESNNQDTEHYHPNYLHQIFKDVSYGALGIEMITLSQIILKLTDTVHYA